MKTSKILWDFKIYMHTDQTIYHHDLDIVLIDKDKWRAPGVKIMDNSRAMGCQY